MGRTISRQVVALDLAVASQATVYSAPINIGRGVNLSYDIELAGTTKDIKLFHQVIKSQTNDVNKIGTPASPGTWRTPATNGTIKDSITADESDSLSVVASKWIRFGVTGLATNTADVTATLGVTIQNDSEAI